MFHSKINKSKSGFIQSLKLRMGMMPKAQRAMRSSSAGFTLIELLVVIAIIGMLSSVVLASMNTARQKARDARRMTDAKALQTAFELVYDDNNRYPLAGVTSGTIVTARNVSTLTSELSDALPKMPKDPTNTATDQGYQYASSDVVHGYAIAIQKEKGGWCQFTEGVGYTPWTYANCSQ